MADTVVPLVADAGKAIFRCFKRKYDFVRNLDKNFDNLEIEGGRLRTLANDINRNAERRLRTGETELWLQDVNKAITDIKGLEIRHLELVLEAKKWLCGLCPFLVLLKLSKDIVAKTTEVVGLQRRRPALIFIESPPPRESPLPTVQTRYTRNTGNLPSQHEMVNQLQEYLKSSAIKKIGIYGIAGVGKTTIMKNLNNELKESDMFDIVIWVDFEKNGNLSTIRDVIVERLRLNVEGINTNQGVATLISEALENRRYLLLLDQVFETINLGEVGIYDGHEHGKLVLASTSKLVCDKMELDELVHVERLSKDDQWKMFRELFGDTIDRRIIQQTAELILKECGGIPSLILAVAKNLRREDEESWRSELTRLRSHNKYQSEDMPEVFNVFKFAYDNLDDKAKNCLLSGAFFPEEHEIYQDYLVECWKAMGFSGEVQKMTEARSEGWRILNDLIDRETLTRSRGRMGHVKMPYIFWRVARIIVYGRVELVPEEMWRQKKISLISSTDPCNFPDAASLEPRTSSISMLFLQSNNNLRIVPEFLFNGMSNLNLLDLSHTGIKSLPESVGKLINLRGLYLNECTDLVSLPAEIKDLKNLEVLDIYRTGFCSLPIEIGELTALMCLRISFTRAPGDQNHVGTTHDNVIVKIPSNLIEKLSFLEELTIDLDPYEPGWNGFADGIAREVANLRDLTTLHFHFPGVACLKTFNRERQSWNNDNRRVIRFTIKVGSHSTRHPHGLDLSGCSAQRHLRYSAGDGTPAAIREVLKDTCAFELIGHRTVENLSDFGIDEMKELEVGIIEECNEMTRILAGNISDRVFPFLKKLHIFGLPRLNCIWEGTTDPESFAKLTTLTLKDCPNIEKILSWGMTQQLPKLEHLKVDNCSQLVKIIGANNQPPGESSSRGLPELKTLELINLPILASICEGGSLKWTPLKTLGIRQCQNLQNLSLEDENKEHLRSIECNEDWWRGLVFQDIQLKEDLQNRCRFI